MSDLDANLTFSNPRREVMIDDFPLGGSFRGKAHYKIESHPKRGERAVRITEKKGAPGQWNKPKTVTYSSRQLIADGSDGRTYILDLSAIHGMITVWKSDFMQAGTVFATLGMERSPNPRFAELLQLFEQCPKE